ncbi:GntR family transcriptional regulator [Berryella wangjianweii]|uniref:GntR family transcriptional regulator n=2 Tax=Berryella wangjianweii TaxID=2734634 RepID=A0A6M8IYP4_9ACTN|nr:GntR family transcriptional regulator [Berryella wangjianweii]
MRDSEEPRRHTGRSIGLKLDHGSGLPVWIQIKNRVVYLIGSGEYAPGDRLPTVRKLAIDLDISYNTVNRAYMDLERDGFVTTRKGRGTFVADSPDMSGARIDPSLSILVDEMIKAASNAGMDEAGIIELVRRRIKGV